MVVTRRYAALQPLNSRLHLYMIFTLAWAGVFYRMHPTPLIGEGRRTLYDFLKILNFDLGILSIVKTITFSFYSKMLLVFTLGQAKTFGSQVLMCIWNMWRNMGVF